MSPRAARPFSVTHELNVLPPRNGAAYPVPCDEWERLVSGLRKVQSSTTWPAILSSVFSSGALATGVNIISGVYEQAPYQLVVAWSATIVCFVLALALAAVQRMSSRIKKDTVEGFVMQMEAIGARFERDSDGSHEDRATGPEVPPVNILLT